MEQQARLPVGWVYGHTLVSLEVYIAGCLDHSVLCFTCPFNEVFMINIASLFGVAKMQLQCLN